MKPVTSSVEIDIPPWEEDDGFFFTHDVAKAQEEIPFTIVLPNYLPPDQRGYIPPPDIMGPLKKHQKEGEVELKISYNINFSDDVISSIIIYEMNYVFLPRPDENNPGYLGIKIGDQEVVKCEGIDNIGSYITFFFHCNDIYYMICCYELPYDESIEIIKSIVM